MSQILVKSDTITRLETITGEHIIRGGDKIINLALDILENKIKEGIKN